MAPKNISINDFSQHLFWDVDKNNLDFEKHSQFLVQRTLDYGLLKDWNLLVAIYGIPKIAKTATNIRDLDPKSMSFISLISQTPVEEFLCYTTRQSMPQHWHF